MLLVSPSRTGLQALVNTASRYAAAHNISFSTNAIPAKSKTKAMVMTRARKPVKPAPIWLNSKELPWVESARYLGCTWTCKHDGMSADIDSKRMAYVYNNTVLNQEFKLAHPRVKSQLNLIYNSAFYGSIIWDLNCKASMALFTAWNTSVRIMWDIPRQTHRCLIELLSGRHTACIVAANFVSFLTLAKKSVKLQSSLCYSNVY